MNSVLKSKIQDKVISYSFSRSANFYTAPEDVRQLLKDASVKLVVKKNTVIYHQGEFSKGVYIIKSGKVKIWQLNQEGNLQLIFIYSEGELFGHRPILANLPQPVSASALEDCELLFVERNKYLNILEQSDLISKTLMHDMSSEFSVLMNKINFFAQSKVKKRLALSLLLLNDIFKTSQQRDAPVKIVMNRIDLAGYVGTSVEHLVRTLRVFKNEGYIKTSGSSIVILDFEALYQISEDC